MSTTQGLMASYNSMGAWDSENTSYSPVNPSKPVRQASNAPKPYTKPSVTLIPAKNVDMAYAIRKSKALQGAKWIKMGLSPHKAESAIKR